MIFMVAFLSEQEKSSITHSDIISMSGCSLKMMQKLSWRYVIEDLIIA